MCCTLADKIYRWISQPWSCWKVHDSITGHYRHQCALLRQISYQIPSIRTLWSFTSGICKRAGRSCQNLTWIGSNLQQRKKYVGKTEKPANFTRKMFKAKERVKEKILHRKSLVLSCCHQNANLWGRWGWLNEGNLRSNWGTWNRWMQHQRIWCGCLVTYWSIHLNCLK